MQDFTDLVMNLSKRKNLHKISKTNLILKSPTCGAPQGSIVLEDTILGRYLSNELKFQFYTRGFVLSEIKYFGFRDLSSLIILLLKSFARPHTNYGMTMSNILDICHIWLLIT